MTEMVRPAQLWGAWSFEPGVAAGVAAAGLLYARAIRTPAGGIDRPRWRVVAFSGGLLGVLVAMTSPLHRLGATLFSAHMVQHLVLILVAGPLLVLGASGKAWSVLPGPLVVWVAHVLILWGWHLPGPYRAALESRAVHAAEHATFLASALAFWGYVLSGGGRRRLGAGGAIFYVFTAALQSSALGALLLFATVELYPIHAAGARAWGLTLLEDQQLAGAIMWIPGGIVYLVTMAVLFARWLNDMDRRMGGSSKPEGKAMGARG